MRKALFTVLLGLSFFMASCDSFGDEVLEDVPVLELVGDIDVTIGLNEEYIDPGVSILGGLDLEVKTTSNLDITKYGIYYIDYDIEFDGSIINVGRKIRVVPQTEIDFNLELEVLSTQPNSLTFLVEIDDEFGALIGGVAELYLLDEKIDELPLTNGTNELVFVGLNNQTYYRVELVGSYTDNDIEYTLDSYSIGAKTTYIDSADYPRLELIGDSEITLSVGEKYTEYGVTIINDSDLEVAINSDVDTTAIGTYTVIYTVIFNYATIYAHRTVIVEEGEELSGFQIDLELDEVTSTSLSYSIDLTDNEDDLFNTYAVLYLGTQEVSRISYTKGENILEFDGLLSNTSYNLVLEGNYYEDGSFSAISGYELETSTLETFDLAPIILLNGDALITLTEGETFVDPGAYVVGIVDADITVTTNVDTSTAGNYYIEYTYDYGSKFVTILRTVIVEGIVKIKPVVSNITYTSTPTTITIEFDVTDDTNSFVSGAVQLSKGLFPFDSIDITSGHNILVFDTDIEVDRYFYATIAITYNIGTYDIIEYFGDEISIYVSPVLTLNGEQEMTVYLTDEFVDPGAYVEGNEDAVITVVSDVDVDIVGTYSVVYSYTSNSNTTTVTRTVIVAEKVLPDMINYVVVTTSTSITIDFDIIDETNSLRPTLVSLVCINDSEHMNFFITEPGHYTFEFERETVPGHEYIQLGHGLSYDIGTDSGETEEDFSFVIPLYANVTFFEESKTIFVGDSTILRIELDNPSDIEIGYVLINDVVYENIVFPSNLDVIYVDIGEHAAGEYMYTISAIGKYYGEDYQRTYETDISNTVTVHELGTIDPQSATVKVLDITTSINGGTTFIPLDDGSETTVYVHLSNRYNLLVTDIEMYDYLNVQITEFEILSPTLISVTVNVEQGEQMLRINSIEYSKNDETIIDLTGFSSFGVIYGYYEADITNIYTVDDFVNMTTSGNYRLMNDIDFDNISVMPLGTENDPFTGSFDGNGYTISNLVIADPVIEEGAYAYIGIFGKSTGFIANVNIDNVVSEPYFDPENILEVINIKAYVGILVGYQSESSIVNVHITNSSITVRAYFGSYAGSIGGLAGEIHGGSDSIIKDSSAETIITVSTDLGTDSSYKYYLGGLIGYDGEYDIIHSYSDSHIYSYSTGYNVNTGGLVGYIEGSTTNNDGGVFIQNSYSNANLSGSYGRFGGLVGASPDDIGFKTYIFNSFTFGVINSNSIYSGGIIGVNNAEIWNSFSTISINTISAFVGAIYGNENILTTSNSLIHNVYSWEDQVLTGVPLLFTDSNITQIISTSNLEFNSIQFYKDFLEFEEYFYDFSVLDVENDILPIFNTNE